VPCIAANIAKPPDLRSIGAWGHRGGPGKPETWHAAALA